VIKKEVLTTWRVERGDLSGQGKKANEQGALTSWKPQKGRTIRTWEEGEREGGTHDLETARGGTC